ncbi:hypothetical protein [Ramlibacter sp.]|uniref:hypothetical protein n=1 Tax=Ramlibacter sp. TaxID=1917967 RepID=UPI002614198A|nr:hypothetical protein [Ramlibacter sp.]MDB5953703.1 hypothetical protein [Ramlibacter sp.]
MNIKSYRCHAAVALVLLQLAGEPRAQPGTAAAAVVSPQVLAQKSAMVDKVLNESPVAARVLSSGNEQARWHFGHARELAAHAAALRTDGLLRAADGLLNEAIWEISRAQQLVPDPGTQQAGERSRYAQLEDSVAALKRTAQIALPPAAATQGESRDMMLARADLLADQAGQLARADRYIEANKQLDAALMLLLRDASARLAGHTIVYDVRFADRHEEFAFELERHRSFERLVPLALLEFRPAPEARALAERNVTQARELRERAEAQFARNPLAAIKDISDGTDALRRALQAAGLVVPQTMESR